MENEFQMRLAALEAENQTLRALTAHSLQPKPEILETPAVCRVAIKLPPLWTDKVALWFAQAEAQFDLAGIVTDTTKFNYVLSQIDHKIAGEVEDIIINLPVEGKYDKLKDSLIKRHSPSSDQKINQLLGETELGERKPSQFLRHLKSLAGPGLSVDQILRRLWMRSLPQHIQGILETQSNNSLEQLADMADRILEVYPGPTTVYSAAAPPLNSTMDKIEELDKQIAALSSEPKRFMKHAASANRVRKRSPNRQEKYCWYHRYYGAKSQKCVPPCNWLAENRTRNQ